MTSDTGLVGVRSSEDLVKALKAPSDPPSGLTLPKIEIAKIVADNQDGLLVPDRFVLICTWVLDTFTQASKSQALKDSASGKAAVAKANVTPDHWLLLDSLLSEKSKLGSEDVKKLAGAHSVVAILTWFAQKVEPSVEVLRACATVIRSLFLHSATKRASNNIDQLNKCLEACFLALPQWAAVDYGSTFDIMAEVSNCWTLACVHAANQKKTFKFFTGEMFGKWTMALSKVKEVSEQSDLFPLVASFGTTALLTEDILRSYCTTATSIYNGAESKDEPGHGDEIVIRICKSLRTSSSHTQASGSAAIAHLLSHLVTSLDSSWITLAPSPIITSLAGPLEQQVYATCIRSAVRRDFLSPICDTIREVSGGLQADAATKATAARTRREILQVVFDLKMLSSATLDDQDWRSWLQEVFADIVADTAVSPSQGLTSLQLLWRLEPTAMEANVVKMFSLIAGEQLHDVSRESIDNAQLLIQYVTNHYARTRELPHLCSVLCDAVMAASDSVRGSEIAVQQRRCSPLFSEDGASAWGQPLRSLLVPNQVGQIIDDLSRRCSDACQIINKFLMSSSAASIDGPSPKRRKTQKGRESTTPESSTTISSGLRQTQSLFRISALIFRYLRIDETSAELSARTLKDLVETRIAPATRVLLDSITNSSVSDTAQIGSLASASLNLQGSISLYYEHLLLTESRVEPLHTTSLASWVDGAKNLSPTLRTDVLYGLLSEVEAATPTTPGTTTFTKIAEHIKGLILSLFRSSLESQEGKHNMQDIFRNLLGRWSHSLVSTFEYETLIELVDHIFDLDLETGKNHTFANSRFMEQPRLLAAICSAAIKRLDRMVDQKSSSVRSPVPVLLGLHLSAIPAPVRVRLLNVSVKADLRLSNLAWDPARSQDLVDLRRYMELLLITETSQTKCCADWLKKVPLRQIGHGNTAFQAATTGAILAASRGLLSQASVSEAGVEAVLSCCSRLQAIEDPAARRIMRGLRCVLTGSKVPYDDARIGALLDTPKLASLRGLAFGTDACVSILDQLQALQQSTSPDHDHSSTLFSEDIIRFLATADEDQSSDTALAVALEVLRIGWSHSKSDRIARWIATLLSVPVLRPHSGALREEVAMRVKESLGASDYEVSLLALEQSLDSLLLNPASVDQQASAVLYTLTLFLCNGPEGTGKVARSSFGRIFQRLDSIPNGSLQELHPTMLLAISDFLESLCRQKAVLLRISDTSEIMHLCAKLVAPSALEHHTQTHEDSGKIFSALVGAMTALVRQRPDIMANVMPSLTALLCQLIVLLRHASPELGSQIMSAAHAGSAPAWLDFSRRSLGSSEADLYSRLLLSLTARSSGVPAIARQKRGTNGGLLESGSISLARPFSKHAIHVLVTYCRMLNSPVLTTDSNVRKVLQPGLFALCDVVKVHERDAAMITSLGSAEQVVFKDLWARWERQRYRGE